ncbi:phosphate transport system substrate-binding protein [Chitinivorax tropicus]|uniref:Phosphate-binding protein PstS n=1 Tax=Chitinivorax tropicus TaxID=714531 RepID=A0A840MQ20_9PROT|nr:phosphate ABC transporter substrate-binding protein PstS [Chitinivorax tropicus]MBB5019545.1 phosphate transport system substrate-binding protein [Chitinivorax tropicus]
MRGWLLGGYIGLMGCLGGPVMALELSAVGSSAAAPLYSKWAASIQKNGGHTLKFDPAGSAKGIESAKGGKVDFGATDALPPAAELTKAGVIAFPTALTAVVPVVNLPGVKPGQIKLNGEVLAKIFSGKIVEWADPAILALNENEKVPSRPIKLVVRADGSGSTFVLTEYLSRMSADWKGNFGAGFSVKWPSWAVQVKGTAGVAASVKATEGAIGYVDFGAVVESGLVDVRLVNAAGKAAKASVSSITDAVLSSAWQTKGDFDELLINRQGNNAWPIVTGTFVLVPKVLDKARGDVLAEFFVRGFMNGDAAVSSASFVKLPDQVKGKATGALSQLRDKSGNPFNMSFF